MEQVIETGSKNIDSKSTSCGSTTIYIDTQCPCVGHWPGQNCSCYQKPTTSRYSIDTPCPDGSNTETETFIASPSLGGGGVHGTSESTTYTGLSGLDGDLAEISEILGYILDLSSREVSWLSQNQDSSNLIYSFLTDNQNSTSSKNFAKEAIIAMMSGANIDFENKYNLDLIQFETFQEFSETINNESLASSTVTSFQDNIVNSIAEFTINRSPLTPCKLDVVISSIYNTQENCYDFDNINTSLSGFTAPYNFKQSKGVSAVVDGDNIFISFSGTLTTGLNIEGYGLFYSETIIIEIKINRFNGEFETAKIIR